MLRAAPIRRVHLAVVVTTLAACGGGQAAVSSTATVDTLANGAVRVRNAAVGEWAASGAQPWGVVEDLRIGRLDGDGPDVFGRISNVFPDAMGRIWTLESQASELRLFDARGGHVRTVGRAGGGPGEFGPNACAFPGPQGEIWVESAARWQRFDSAGVLLGGMPVTRSLGCGMRTWTSDGRFLAVTLMVDPATRERVGHYIEHRMSAQGELIVGDTFPGPTLPPAATVTWLSPNGRMRMTMPVPFWPRGTLALAHTGDFWVSDGGGSYAFRRQSLEGDTLLVVERAYDPVPIDGEARETAIREFRREGFTSEEPFDPATVPGVHPPFERVVPATDGTVWVFRTVAGGAAGADVFTTDGRFLGSAGLPTDFGRMQIHLITADHMYGVARDELDVQHVVRLRIARP